MKIVPGILIVLQLTCVFSVFGQHPSFFNINGDNGAPSNEIYCILQDQEGYLWIGSDAGIFRFNGIQFKHYTSSKLLAKSATGLTQSSQGRIYGYNFRGQLFYVDGDSLSVIDNWDKPINGIQIDDEQNVWISGGLGTYKFDSKHHRSTLITSTKHITTDGVAFTDNICRSTNNEIFYHNSGQVMRLTHGDTSVFKYSKEQYNLPCFVNCFEDQVWLVSITGEHVYHLLNGKWNAIQSLKLKKTLYNRKVNSIYQYKDDELLICTYSGLIRYNFVMDEVEVWFENSAISDALLDREGNLWLTTLHEGLIRIPNTDIRCWTPHSAGVLQNQQLTGITSSGQKLYAAGSSGNILEIEVRSGVTISYPHLPVADLGMIYYDQIDQCVYFNKLNILYRLKEGKIDIVNDQARPVKAMLHTEQGYLFLSSQGLYSTRIISEPLDADHKVVDDWFRDVVHNIEYDSYFLVGNKGGYEVKLRDGKGKLIKHFFNEQQILSITTDSDSRKLYFLDARGNIYHYDPKRGIQMFLQLGVTIRPNLMKIKNGIIYLGTNQGLYSVSITTKKITQYTRHSGLSSNIITGILLDESGNIWLSTGRGVCVVKRLKEPGKGLAKLIVRKIKVDDREVHTNETLVLKYNESIKIEVDGLSYSSNKDFQYAYLIDGINKDWIKLHPSNGEILLSNLPSGTYAIHIKVIDYTGKDSLNTFQLSVNVSPPFWQRWWFYVLIILSVGTLVFLIFRKRELLLREKQEKELKHLKLENELRLTQQSALKAQMNPHFLFNVLNSIKGFIYENDKKNAAKYLSDFSNLVRKVLDSSSAPTISLEEEIELLKLYVNLEAMLLEDGFKFELILDETVDAANIEIPALLIQPYIENAFKHGLRHKQGTKQLEIKISYIESSETLHIQIKDNGIGRAAAAIINDQNNRQHRSFATEAMEKRLSLLNHNQKDLVGVEISDIFDSEDQPAGTKVNIQIHV